MAESISCPECDAKIKKGSKFCSECGTEIAPKAPSECLSCGNTLEGKEKFCPSCGTEIGARRKKRRARTRVSENAREPIIEEVSQGDVRNYLTAIASQLSAVDRELYVNNNEKAWLSIYLSALDRFRNDSALTHICEEFENTIFLKILGFRASEKHPTLVNDIWNNLPNRFEPYLEDLNKVSTLKLDGEWNQIHSSWPYITYAISHEIPIDALGKMLQQTAREAFFVLNQSVATRSRFLEDEKVRLDNNLYPSKLKPTMSKLHSKLERFLKKTEAEFSKGGPDAEAKAVCAIYIAPLAVPEIVQRGSEIAHLQNVPFPFSHEPLSEWDKEQLRNLLDGSYDRESAVSFLEGCYENLTQQLGTMTAGGSLGGIGMRGLEELHSMMEIAHRYLTTLLNMLSRMLRPSEHEDYPYWPPMRFAPDLLNRMLKKVDPEFEKALCATVNSLYFLQWQVYKSYTPPAAEAGSSGPRKSRGRGATRKPSGKQGKSTSAGKQAGRGKASNKKLKKELQETVDDIRRLEADDDPQVILYEATLLTIAEDNYKAIGLKKSDMDNMSAKCLIPWLEDNGWIE